MKAMEKMVENTVSKVLDDKGYVFRTKKDSFVFSAKFLLEWCGVDILCHYDEERLKELLGLRVVVFQSFRKKIKPVMKDEHWNSDLYQTVTAYENDMKNLLGLYLTATPENDDDHVVWVKDFGTFQAKAFFHHYLIGLMQGKVYTKLVNVFLDLYVLTLLKQFSDLNSLSLSAKLLKKSLSYTNFEAFSDEFGKSVFVFGGFEQLLLREFYLNGGENAFAGFLYMIQASLQRSDLKVCLAEGNIVKFFDLLFSFLISIKEEERLIKFDRLLSENMNNYQYVPILENQKPKYVSALPSEIRERKSLGTDTLKFGFETMSLSLEAINNKNNDNLNPAVTSELFVGVNFANQISSVAEKATLRFKESNSLQRGVDMEVEMWKSLLEKMPCGDEEKEKTRQRIKRSLDFYIDRQPKFDGERLILTLPVPGDEMKYYFNWKGFYDYAPSINDDEILFYARLIAFAYNNIDEAYSGVFDYYGYTLRTQTYMSVVLVDEMCEEMLEDKIVISLKDLRDMRGGGVTWPYMIGFFMEKMLDSVMVKSFPDNLSIRKAISSYLSANVLFGGFPLKFSPALRFCNKLVEWFGFDSKEFFEIGGYKKIFTQVLNRDFLSSLFDKISLLSETVSYLEKEVNDFRLVLKSSLDSVLIFDSFCSLMFKLNSKDQNLELVDDLMNELLISFHNV